MLKITLYYFIFVITSMLIIKKLTNIAKQKDEIITLMQLPQFNSVTQLCLTLFNPMNRSTPGLPVHHQLPEFTQTPCPSSRWCHPAISSFVIPFSSCPQSLPASGSFPMSQLFAWGDQSIGVSASASVLPMNPQDWSPLRWAGWISLQSKGLSRVFSNTTVQKHQFFSTQLFSQSNSPIHTCNYLDIMYTAF